MKRTGTGIGAGAAPQRNTTDLFSSHLTTLQGLEADYDETDGSSAVDKTSSATYSELRKKLRTDFLHKKAIASSTYGEQYGYKQWNALHIIATSQSVEEIIYDEIIKIIFHAVGPEGFKKMLEAKDPKKRTPYDIADQYAPSGNGRTTKFSEKINQIIEKYEATYYKELRKKLLLDERRNEVKPEYGVEKLNILHVVATSRNLEDYKKIVERYAHEQLEQLLKQTDANGLTPYQLAKKIYNYDHALVFQRWVTDLMATKASSAIATTPHATPSAADAKGARPIELKIPRIELHHHNENKHVGFFALGAGAVRAPQAQPRVRRILIIDVRSLVRNHLARQGIRRQPEGRQYDHLKMPQSIATAASDIQVSQIFNFNDHQIGQDYRCPLSLSFIAGKVAKTITPAGKVHYFEDEAIRKEIHCSGKHPITRQPLSENQLIDGTKEYRETLLQLKLDELQAQKLTPSQIEEQLKKYMQELKWKDVEVPELAEGPQTELSAGAGAGAGKTS